MVEYKGNAIYDYVVENGLGYFFSAENCWILVYGDSCSIPKILVFACKTDNFKSASKEVKTNANRALKLAGILKLPFICVCFMSNVDTVSIWESKNKYWKKVSYGELRDIYEEYGVVRPGTAKKAVNQYVSSPYHDWQRNNLGRITVSDFDLLKYRGNQITEIIELKRSKINVDSWSPFEKDFPNFALLINSIVNSGTKIPFKLYYNKMYDGTKGNRKEDISNIKVFDFVIPDKMISSNQIEYYCRGIHSVEELLL